MTIVSAQKGAVPVKGSLGRCPFRLLLSGLVLGPKTCGRNANAAGFAFVPPNH